MFELDIETENQIKELIKKEISKANNNTDNTHEMLTMKYKILEPFNNIGCIDGINIFLAGPCPDSNLTKDCWRLDFISDVVYNIDKRLKLYNKSAMILHRDMIFYGLRDNSIFINFIVPTVSYNSKFDINTCDRYALKKYHRWTMNRIAKSDIIVFWIPRYLDKKEYALHTNIEVGTCLALYPEKCLIDWPEDADKMTYIEDYIDYCKDQNSYNNYNFNHDLNNLAEITTDKLLSIIAKKKGE